MDKTFFAFLVVFCLSLSIVSATDIALVVEDSIDLGVVNAIEDEGYSYDVIDEDSIPLTDFSDYEMILIIDERIDNYEMIPVKQKNSLVMNTYHLDDWGIAKYAGIHGTTGYHYARILKLNTITNSFPSPVQLYDVKGRILYSLPYADRRAPGLENVVSTNNYHQYPVIGTILPGGELYGGGVAGERIAFFGATDTSIWTSLTEQLFKNTIEWVLIGSDDDLDGFYYDVDCDDKNASINPDATEIAYNEIDEDCDGFDLVDVDEDGYDAEPWGGDCDDSDESINPGSFDVYKNCANDAPVISPVIKRVVYETDLVEVEFSAVDPENDSISFSVNDSRFLKNQSLFSWQTDYNDSGDYIFRVFASDGVLESNRTFSVEVRNRNQPPVVSLIPDVVFNEDESFVLNLSEYFSDPDDGFLIYAVNATSDDTSVTVSGLGNGLMNFSADAEWSGSDWIIFMAFDGSSLVSSNNITINVLPVNDVPVFYRDLENITWNEDSDLVNRLDLNDYFEDVDSNLSFNVSGNLHVDVQINESFVSFYPEQDWHGVENIFFSANDEQSGISSNAFSLNVVDVGEPPVFDVIVCEDEINEDMSYECNLSASDFENDSFIFEVVSQDNLNCGIVGSVLEYVSYGNYNGNASCLVRVADDDGSDEFLFEVNVLPINDAPRISDYSPKGVLRIMEFTNQLFSLVVSDVDSVLNYLWFLDGVEVGLSNNYLFNNEKGNYNLTTVVSDGEFDVFQEWNIFVGNISDFTCQEVGAYVCDFETEICEGDILGVYDSDSCCSIRCSERPPDFLSIEKCELLNQNISLEIVNPDSGEDFSIGESINVKVKVENEFEDELDFDVEVYFYDIDEEDVIDDGEEDFDLGKGDKETVNFEFDVETDFDESHEYAIYVKVVDEEERCNGDYVRIDIKREKHDVVIKSAELWPFGENSFEINIEVENLGRDDEEVYLRVENSDLEVSQKGEVFELDADDSEKQSFLIKVPEQVSGEYQIKITADFSGEKASEFLSLVIKDKQENQGEQEVVEDVSLNKGDDLITGSVVDENSDGEMVLLTIPLVVVVLLIIGLIVYLFWWFV